MIFKNSKFDYGKTYLTRAVDLECKNDPEFSAFVNESFQRHIEGDWGDTCEEDAALNEEALMSGDRIFSVYNKKDDEGKTGKTVWIITENTGNDIFTTILFPGDY